MGATETRQFIKVLSTVSIHAPVMGATEPAILLNSKIKVSIHAPVMGATGRGELCEPNTTSFNPRARDGRDGEPTVELEPRDVSIHAPVMGATLRSRLLLWKRKVSIHAPVMGATVVLVKGAGLLTFQSTRP